MQRRLNLIYEDKARFDLWLKVILACIPLMMLVLGIILLSEEPEASRAMFGVTVFIVLLFYAVMPRKYQVYTESVRIVLGWPFAFKIPLSKIKEVKPGSGMHAYLNLGLSFATSAKTVLTIVRRKGMTVYISPFDRGRFLEEVSQVLEAWQASHDKKRASAGADRVV